MLRQLWALLWKEWREGWPVMVPLWVAAPGVGAWVRSGAEGERLPREYMGSMLGVAFLCFAAALVAGRLFASEGESGTARFLLRQPVSRAMVWGAKLLAGVGFLAVLYGVWFAARGSEGQWLIWLTSERRAEYAVSEAEGTLEQGLERGTPAQRGESGVPRPSPDLGVRRGTSRDGNQVSYWANPQATWWALVAFGAALFLSTVLDNAVLAFVGGMVAWMPFAAGMGIYCQLAGSRIAEPEWDEVYLGTPALIAVLTSAAAFLALSCVAFHLRKGRG